MDTNQELRVLKAKYNLTTADILDLLTSITGGPSISAINSWLAVRGCKMPANSWDLLNVNLKKKLLEDKLNAKRRIRTSNKID